MGAKPRLRLLALLIAGALLGTAGAALAQTPASVQTTPEPSMSATPARPTPPNGGGAPQTPAVQSTRVPVPTIGPTRVAPDTSPTATAATPSNGQAITITPSDNGRTFNVVVNQRIVVQLGAMLDWSVSYQPEGILLAVPGVNALARGTQAILYAAAPGTVTITAQGKPICSPGQACPQFVTQFQATVIVAAGSTTTQQPSGQTVSQQSAPAAPPAQPIHLPNTGRHTSNVPLLPLLASALALALAGCAAWRRSPREDTTRRESP